MPRLEKSWIDKLRTVAWINQVRNIIWFDINKSEININEVLKNYRLPEDSLLPNELLPKPTDIQDWWSMNGDGSDISKSMWSRWIRGVREPGKTSRDKIINIISKKYGHSWTKQLEDLWMHGPDGAPLWISLKKDDEKIIKMWSSYLTQLSQLYTGPASETINQVAIGVCNVDTKNKIDPITKKNTPPWKGTPPTGWRLAASIAVLRLNWSQYVNDSRKKLTIQHEIAYSAMYYESIDPRIILREMNNELERDRVINKDKRKKLIEAFEGIIPLDTF